MPLPPALLARLSKRGIVTAESEAKRKKLEEEQQQKEPEEEIIAEDYDDDEAQKHDDDRGSDGESDDDDDDEDEDDEEDEDGADDEDGTTVKLNACPNLRNPYHECTAFCAKKWGAKSFNPDKENERKRRKMMSKYPLPENWVEEPDVWTGRYYYWNLETDEVSWFPPGHPRAKIGLPAKKIILMKSKMKTAPKQDAEDEEEESESDEEEEEDADRRRKKERESGGNSEGSDSGSDSESESRSQRNNSRAPSRSGEDSGAAALAAAGGVGRVEVDRRRDTNTPSSGRGPDAGPRPDMPPPPPRGGGGDDRGRPFGRPGRRGEGGGGGGRGPPRGAGKDALDPMDPASYSDIPRGKWSDGLPTQAAEAKTGVDSTASGVLFQMRPYPSPGAVLRANAAAAGGGPPGGEDEGN